MMPSSVTDSIFTFSGASITDSVNIIGELGYKQLVLVIKQRATPGENIP